jgi:chitodextrinase
VQRIARQASVLVLLLLVPTLSHGAAPQPWLGQWETRMTSFGQQVCDSLIGNGAAKLESVYYDGMRVFIQMREYTGTASWETTCMPRARAISRDAYEIPNNGNVQGYRLFTKGLRRDWERNANATSRDTALLLSTKAYAADSTPLAWTESPEKNREVAYAIMSHIDARALGQAPRTRTTDLVEQAFRHIDQWFTARSYRASTSTADTAGLPAAAGNFYIQPFMVSLTARALIEWNDIVPDSRVLPAVKLAADTLWTWAYQAASQTMWYQNYTANPNATPVVWSAPLFRVGDDDLNLLIAPMYEWVYQQTGIQGYRDKADLLFQGAIDTSLPGGGAYLGAGKQFNQNYIWSFQYVSWRNITFAGGDVTNPSAPGTLVATPNGPTRVDLSWGAATDNVGVTGYRVERCTGAGCSSWAEIAQPSGLTYSDTGRTAATTYRYRVRAVDGSGNLGAYTSIVDATTPATDSTNPSAVSGLAVVEVRARRIELSWTAATDNVAVTGYRVERCQGASCTGFVQIGTTTGVTYTDTGLNFNTTYRYQVRAEDAAGNLGAYSSAVQQTTLQLGAKWPCNAQSGTSVTDTSGNANTGTVTGGTFQNDPAEGYVLNLGATGRVAITTPTSGLDIAGPVSLHARVRPNPSAATHRTIVVVGSPGVRGYGMSFINGKLNFINIAVADVTSTSVAVLSDTWQTVEITFNPTADQVKFYRDGQLQETIVHTPTTTAPLAADAAYIASWLDGTTSTLDGSIRDVRVYGYTRSDQEIADEFGTEPPTDSPPPPPPIDDTPFVNTRPPVSDRPAVTRPAAGARPVVGARPLP